MEDYLLNGRIKSKPIYFCHYRMFKRIIRRFFHVLKMTVISVLVVEHRVFLGAELRIFEVQLKILYVYVASFISDLFVCKEWRWCKIAYDVHRCLKRSRMRKMDELSLGKSLSDKKTCQIRLKLRLREIVSNCTQW